MTATLQPESKSTSRRAVLAGALGGLGALAASAIGRATPVRAADGDTVLVGFGFTATGTTVIDNFTTSSTVFACGSSSGTGLQGTSDSSYGVYGSSGSGKGVYGSSSSYYGVHGVSDSSYGVLGTSNSNAGVYGSSSSNIGVLGTSSSYYGVKGLSYAVDQPASLGYSGGNSTGVQGVSGASLPAAKAKTGVYGYAAQDNFSSGVIGESPAGVGVRGHTTTGYAGYFEGRVYTNAFYELTEISTPASPIANRARLFSKDNGVGKTQLCVKFANGTVKILATEG